MNHHVIQKAALDDLLDNAGALVAAARDAADSFDHYGLMRQATELRMLADRYEVCRRVIEDPEGV